MHVFSTVFFVDGNPVGYKVFKEENRLFLNPAENPNRRIPAPAMRAQHEGGRWLIEGTSDRDFINQVIEDVSTTGHQFMRHELSAAP